MVIGLAESQLASEERLRAPGAEGDPRDPPQSLEPLDSCEYLALRGEDEISALMCNARRWAVPAVRERTGECVGTVRISGASLTMLSWAMR